MLKWKGYSMRGKRVVDSWLLQDNRQPFDVKVSGTPTTSSGEIVHDWVRAGRGIAQKASWDLAADLEDGSLVQCLEILGRSIELLAITANRMHQPIRIRLFLEFIAKRLPLRVARTAQRRKGHTSSD